ncbi:MAG: thiamine-phosphate kinase [Chloroflexi bacterium]|nr:thiamine-phosphate kinase [Chloroflexota bacterium]
MNQNTTKTLGEHKIIQIIQNRLTPMPNLPVPFGDDVSAVNLDEKRVAVLKTDMLVGKTDVPKEMSLYQAARKALIMNISDFASKGAKPTAALVALGLPQNFTQKDIEEIADGLNAGAQEYGAYIIGGDTGEASDLVISVSLYGSAQKSALMLRSGAEAGDVLAVTGFFGKPSAGLRLLLGGCEASADLKRVFLDAVFLPKARLAEGLALGGSGVVSASIDSSDGLAWSIHEIARQSGVGFVLDRVPVADEVKEFAKADGLDASELALYGGEEYELVITVKPKGWDRAAAAVKAVGGQLLPIGKATSGREVVLEVDGKKRSVEARGWEHFKSQP